MKTKAHLSRKSSEITPFYFIYFNEMALRLDCAEVIWYAQNEGALPLRFLLKLVIFFCIAFIFSGTRAGLFVAAQGGGEMEGKIIKLPEPAHKGSVSLEEAINRRHSVREFRKEELTLNEVSQLLWACAGRTFDSVTGATRTYPSAGGLYPLEMYLAAGDVDGLAAGIYHYLAGEHALTLEHSGDVRRELAHAALGQFFIAEAPASIVISAVYERTAMRYGERGRIRYVHMDAGHAAQNVYLQAVALGLGTVTVGAFDDERVKKVLRLTRGEPLCIMPVGKPR